MNSMFDRILLTAFPFRGVAWPSHRDLAAALVPSDRTPHLDSGETILA